ncbi:MULTISPECIES: 2-oxo acid dehydrogenase subunit E2 [Pseudomonas]|uniref:2-oxo acid dehydrogenase subunit E2 n=1 Tax=Pseudomonas TaxID=286 RepID=UPI0012397D25|nr:MULTISPECIES: 2-oxo acid dehydrogenase subunit E2 [Pseudomonas]QIB51206.1 dihydrolipoamide acetyltransferase [Pseudomonas sp. OIL-1]
MSGNDSNISAWPANLPPMPEVDFTQFGEVERAELSRHQQYAGAFLGRNWAHIPHVTHNDEAPTEKLNAFRRAYGAEIGCKLTPLPFLIKALVNSLKEFPIFNASLATGGKQVVLKKYYHVGIAVETEKGLLVPVIRDADRKTVADLQNELNEKAMKARTKGLPINEMSGGCMTISSLGSIGGTSFTPIINAPELAILGITREFERLVMEEDEIVTRRFIPLSLSYDHRVINGADAARFCRFFADQLVQPELLI